MPGRSGDSRAGRLVGLAAAAVAVVGTVVFGWEFGGPTASVPVAVGLLFAAVGLFVWVRSR